MIFKAPFQRKPFYNSSILQNYMCDTRQPLCKKTDANNCKRLLFIVEKGTCFPQKNTLIFDFLQTSTAKKTLEIANKNFNFTSKVYFKDINHDINTNLFDCTLVCHRAT